MPAAKLAKSKPAPLCLKPRQHKPGCYCARPWKARPKVCLGPDRHREGCHPARPRCRWMRDAQKGTYRATCNCSGVHHPHRIGTLTCVHQDPAKLERAVLGPKPARPRFACTCGGRRVHRVGDERCMFREDAA